jgi:hypothetical protein
VSAQEIAGIGFTTTPSAIWSPFVGYRYPD